MNLKAFRKQLSLTQVEAGRLFGATLRTWEDWEAGRRKPHGSTLLLLKLVGERPELIEWLRRQANAGP